MNWGKANTAAVVSCLCSTQPGNPEDFSSVIHSCNTVFGSLVGSSPSQHLMASNPLLWKSRQQFSKLSCKLQHSYNFLQSKEPCQVPHSLCFFQMLLWVSQMVPGTYGCAAEFPVIFFQWNVLILSSRILTQLIFNSNFYLPFHSEMKGCITWNFRIVCKMETVNLDQVSIGI